MMDVGSLTAASVTNTTIAFFAFMPTPGEIATGGASHSVRVNEASAVAVSVGMGVALSILGRDGKPLAAALVASVVLLAGYEYLARTTDVRITSEENRRDPNVRI